MQEQFPKQFLFKATLTPKSGLGNANFAQNTYKEVFSKRGRLELSKIAGQSIRSIDDLAGALKSGGVKASDIPVNYILRGGNKLILNTRTAQALQRAGISRSRWNAINRTGNSLFEKLLTGQLQRNKLTSQGVLNPISQ